MAKNPWMKFWIDNWQTEPAFLMVSFEARALWLEMLCMMHRSTEPGCLLINGQTPSSEMIAASARTTVDLVDRCLDELEKANVFSRKKNGVIYSRKMVRDEKKSRINRENGKKGADATHGKTTKKPKSPGRSPRHKKKEVRSKIFKRGDYTRKEIESMSTEDDPIWFIGEWMVLRRSAYQDYEAKYPNIEFGSILNAQDKYWNDLNNQGDGVIGDGWIRTLEQYLANAQARATR